MKTLILATALMVALAPAYAAKCVDSNGHITYKSGPCTGMDYAPYSDESTYSSVRGRDAQAQLQRLRSMRAQPYRPQRSQQRPSEPSRLGYSDRMALKNNKKSALRDAREGKVEASRVNQRENAGIRGQYYDPGVNVNVRPNVTVIGR